MKQSLKIVNIRCSIFVPKVTYNPENLQKMLGAFPGYLPSTIQSQILPIPMELAGLPVQMDMQNTPWQISKASEKTVISFFDDKIDVVIQLEGAPYDLNLLAAKSKDCYDIFKKIITTFNFVSVRLAIAPTIALQYRPNEGVSKQKFLQKMYALNTFNNTPNDTCDFSQVYRINKNLNNATYLVNHLAKFTTEQQATIQGNSMTIRENLVVSLDVNTFVNPIYNMKIAELKDFYEQSPSWCDELLDYYFQTEDE